MHKMLSDIKSLEERSRDLDTASLKRVQDQFLTNTLELKQNLNLAPTISYCPGPRPTAIGTSSGKQ